MRLNFHAAPPDIDAVHLNETINLCREAYDGRRRMRPIGGIEMIVSQLRFIAKPIWALQMAVILCICLLLRLASGAGNAGYVPALLSLGAIFTAMSALPFYGRSQRYKMRELESASRLSRGKLILAKLCVVGAGDAACLTLLTLASPGAVTQAAGAMLTFIALPFLLTCTGSLLILNRTREDRGVFAALAFGLVLAAVYWAAPAKIAALPASLGTPIPAAACALLLAALVLECRRLLKKPPSPDAREALIY